MKNQSSVVLPLLSISYLYGQYAIKKSTNTFLGVVSSGKGVVCISFESGKWLYHLIACWPWMKNNFAKLTKQTLGDPYVQSS